MSDRSGEHLWCVYFLCNLRVSERSLLASQRTNVDDQCSSTSSVNKLVEVWIAAEIDGDRGESEILEAETFLSDHKIIPENDLGGQIESKEQRQYRQD